MSGRRGVHPRHLDLVRAFPLRPLRSETELKHAVEVINCLIDRDDLDAGEADYLKVLGDLVERYETLYGQGN